jgi:hypothetical protein
LKQALVTVLRHPAGAGEMGLEGAARTTWLPRRIDAQNNACHFLPVSTLSLGVGPAQARDRVPMVVSG